MATKQAKPKVKKPCGRPKKFSDVEILQKKITKYFKDCDKNEDPYTICGLALALDTTRETLLDYENKYPGYSDTIKKAKLICENYSEKKLFEGKNVVGVIFNLKNNYRWLDKQEVEHSGGLSLTQILNEAGNKESK
jgi:hypothetical protein